MEAVIDVRIKKAVMFHDVLHGFHMGRGMGTFIMELNIAQELVRVDKEPILLVLHPESLLQPGPWSYTAYLGGVRVEAENAGNYGVVLVAAGGGHPIKRVPWPPVQGDPWYHPRGDGIAKIL